MERGAAEGIPATADAAPAADAPEEGLTVAVWGLTFKAGTGDLRASPAPEIARRGVAAGAPIHAFAPPGAALSSGPAVVGDPALACEGADILLVATEWPGFVRQDFARIAEVMATPVVLDARNLLDRDVMRRAGFVYEGIGIP